VIKLISGYDRESLREIYENEFDSEMPTDEQANVVAIIDDGELQAFMTAETLLRTDQWWVSPSYRGTAKAAVLIRRIARYLFGSVPKGTGVIIFAANENQGRLFEKLGFRPIEGKIYRLDT
jgi:predicted GNAT family acetyltransferase